MDQDRLVALLARPETHRMILGDYQGCYSLGLTLLRGQRGAWAVRVRIEGDDASNIPEQITLDGATLPVVVSTGFQTPRPLNEKA
jgi:hypothetical protein